MLSPITASPRKGTELPAGVWFTEPSAEMTIFSENYDFTVSLLQLQNDSGRSYLNDEDEDQTEDLACLIRRKHNLAASNIEKISAALLNKYLNMSRRSASK